MRISTSPVEVALYQARGLELFYTGKDILVLVPSVCQHLTEQGCDIYENRPLACKVYDARNSLTIGPKCLWNML